MAKTRPKMRKKKQKKMKAAVSTAVSLPIACLTDGDKPEPLPICVNTHGGEYEKVFLMIDSGASETVASETEFGGYPLQKTTATGVTYAGAAEQRNEITNVGEKCVETIDENGVTSWKLCELTVVPCSRR